MATTAYILAKLPATFASCSNMTVTLVQQQQIQQQQVQQLPLSLCLAADYTPNGTCSVANASHQPIALPQQTHIAAAHAM
jgi:hypothetical protein